MFSTYEICFTDMNLEKKDDWDYASRGKWDLWLVGHTWDVMKRRVFSCFYFILERVHYWGTSNQNPPQYNCLPTPLVCSNSDDNSILYYDLSFYIPCCFPCLAILLYCYFTKHWESKFGERPISGFLKRRNVSNSLLFLIFL